LVSAPPEMLARKPERRQHTRAWKVASSSRSLSHTAKIGSGSTVADTTAGTASAGKAAAEATIERCRHFFPSPVCARPSYGEMSLTRSRVLSDPRPSYRARIFGVEPEVQPQ
jgi:hypothetical protein